MGLFESRNSFEHIDKLSYEIGPRLAGSDRSLRAAEYIKENFEDMGLDSRFQEFDFIDKVRKVRFQVSFLAAVFVGSLFLNLYVSPLITLAVWIAVALLSYKVESFLPEEIDRNVVGVLKADKEPKKRVLVGAHYDSANCVKSRKWSSIFKIILKIVTIAFTGLLVLTAIIGQEIWIGGWVFLSIPYLFACILPFWFYEDLISPGADDNASGVSVMLEAARVASGNKPEDVEIIFVAFGGEEQGLKGSESFSKISPKPDLFLNIDTVGSGGKLAIVQGNGVVRKSRTSTKLNSRISEERDLKRIWTPFAGHDHIPFIKEGVESTTLTSCSDKGESRLDRILEKVFKIPNVRTYRHSQLHTPDDVPEEIKLENIKKSGEITLSFLGIEEEG